MKAKTKGINRRLKSVTEKVHKKRATKHHMTAAEKLEARKAHARYRRRKTPGDVKFDKIRSKIRAKFRSGKHGAGRPLKAGPADPTSVKAGRLLSRMNRLTPAAAKSRPGKPNLAARSLAHSGKQAVALYKTGRHSLRKAGVEAAHLIAGKAIAAHEKLMKAAKTPEQQAAAEAKSGKILSAARNKAVRVLKDTRRDLTTMRVAARRGKAALAGNPKAARTHAPKPKAKAPKTASAPAAPAPAPAAPAAPKASKPKASKPKAPKASKPKASKPKAPKAPKASKPKASKPKAPKIAPSTPSQIAREVGSAMF
jgi:hypothetical protein